MLKLSRRLSIPISLTILALSGAAFPVSAASAFQTKAAEPDANRVSPRPESWGKPDFGAFCRALKRALVRRDVAAMALLIEYPLRFNQDGGGTITLENARALETHFDEIFPPGLRAAMANHTEDDTFLVGDDIGFLNGDLWVELTGPENAARYRVKVVNAPYPQQVKPGPVRGLRYACETEKHLIVIDDAGSEKVRYRSWNKPHFPPHRPDLELTSDNFGVEGMHECSAWTWSFVRGDTTYKLDERGACRSEEIPDARATLSVAVKGKVKQSWWCY
jgi:hypothetical protein